MHFKVYNDDVLKTTELPKPENKKKEGIEQ